MQMLSHWIQNLAIACLVIAFFLSLLVCYRFKDVLIKLVALEVLVNLFICGVGVWALKVHFPLLLDICIALSLIMFLSTVAYCQLLMRRLK